MVNWSGKLLLYHPEFNPLCLTLGFVNRGRLMKPSEKKLPLLWTFSKSGLYPQSPSILDIRYVMCHVSCVNCNMSPVTCHLSLCTVGWFAKTKNQKTNEKSRIREKLNLSTYADSR